MMKKARRDEAKRKEAECLLHTKMHMKIISIFLFSELLQKETHGLAIEK